MNPNPRDPNGHKEKLTGTKHEVADGGHDEPRINLLRFFASLIFDQIIAITAVAVVAIIIWALV